MINFPKFDDDLGLDVEGYADGIGAGGDLRPLTTAICFLRGDDPDRHTRLFWIGVRSSSSLALGCVVVTLGDTLSGAWSARREAEDEGGDSGGGDGHPAQDGQGCES